MEFSGLVGFEIFVSSPIELFLTKITGQRAKSTTPDTLALFAAMELTSSILLMNSTTAADPSVGSVNELGPTADVVEPKSPSSTPNGTSARSIGS